MRNLIVVWSLVACAVTAAAADQAGTSSSPRYRFGTVKQGETVVHTFMLQNAGAAPLRITGIELSAPGMTAKAGAVIGAGEQGQVVVEWDTESVARQVTGTATVRFEDPNEPALTLELAGTVVPPIDGVPIWGFFISAFRDQPVRRSIRIVNNQDHPIEILKLGSASRSFTPSLKTRTAGKVYELTIDVPAGLPPGHHTEMIALETDDPKLTRLQVPVNLFIKNDLFANPDEIDFGELDRLRLAANARLLDAVAQRIILERRSGTFAIEAVRSDLPALQAQVTPQGPSRRFQIELQLAADRLQPGDLSGTLHVLTSDERFPDVAIPVRGQVK